MSETKTDTLKDLSPETIEKPLTDEQKEQIQKDKDSLDWSNPPKEEDGEIKEPKKKEPKEEIVVLDEDKKAEEEAAAEAKAEEDRLTVKAEELGKTVDEVKEIEVEETKQETDRIAKLAEEQGKTVEEIVQQEADAKAAEDTKTVEQKEQARLEELAKEEGITVDEVKAAEEKDSKVVENYDKDPLKIAKALRKENAAYGKIKAENDKLVEYKKTVEAQQLRYNEERTDAILEEKREKVVEEYLKFNPKETEENEGVLFERAKIKIKGAMQANDLLAEKEVQKQADETRETLMDSISDEFKEYKPEIKEVMKKQNNEEVVSSDFDITNVCYWARGKKFTPDYVKSLEDAAYKRGKEQPEIIEKKTTAVSTGERSTSLKKEESLVSTATEVDRQRALEIHSAKDDWSDEKKIEEYMKTGKKNDQW